MLKDIILLVVGLALIIAGGNYVTDGAEAIARRLRMSGLMVGLTVVAMGSSTPDLVVCVMSSITGKGDLAIGSEVGAVIFDTLLVIGIMALVKPFAVKRSTLGYEFPMMAFAATVVFFMCDDKFFDNGATNIMTRSDGLVLLAIFLVYMVYLVYYTRQQQRLQPQQTPAANAAPAPKKKTPMWLAIVMVLGGLGALVLGGDWTVDGASGLARHAGMSEGLIGLTIVGIGSSLPDLSTSIVATLKGQTDIALGNVLGSCFIDTVFVLGASAVISPLGAVNITFVDFATFAGSAYVVWLMAQSGHQLTRLEGGILTAMYVAYVVYLVIWK